MKPRDTNLGVTNCYTHTLPIVGNGYINSMAPHYPATLPMKDIASFNLTRQYKKEIRFRGNSY